MPDEWEWLVDELSLSEDYFSGVDGNASTRGAGATKESQSLVRLVAKREAQETPLGIILCAGKNTHKIELLELRSASIHVTEYFTVLPPADVFRAKLHNAIETARRRLELRD
jgi:hypothetical protein